MMKSKIFFFIVLAIMGSLASYAQSKNYNLKKGYVANGYDVVSYFNDAPEEGKKEYVVIHDGVKFKFATAENLETFKENPERYAPKYGGYCAYAVAVSGKKVSINPKTYEIRNDELYLFYNSGKTNTLELWKQEAPEELKEKADANWKKIVEK